MAARVIHASAVGAGLDGTGLDLLVASALAELDARIDALGLVRCGEVAFTLAASEYRTRVVAWCTARDTPQGQATDPTGT